MSLLHRTTSHESFSRTSSSSNLVADGRAATDAPHSVDAPSGLQSRRLSYNPIAKDDAPPPAAVPAYEVSQSKRIVQVGIAVVYCLLAAGIVFGYAAIKPVLIAEGVYRESCTKDELRKNVYVCYQQEIRLNFMFTVAAVSTNIAALPIGIILDRFGPRITSMLGTVFLSIGALLLALEANVPFDGYIPGYLFLALGGPFVFIPSFQLSNTFPKYSGLILALLTGAFDTSSAVFLMYRLIYEATGQDFKPRYFFFAYLVVPVFIFFAQLFLMPAKSYQTVGELLAKANEEEINQVAGSGEGPPHDPDGATDGGRRGSAVSEVTALLGTKDAQEHIRREEAAANASGVAGTLQGLPASKQLLTPWFALIAIFTIVQMLRINFFIATVRPQYNFLLSSQSKAAAINAFFDIALPAGGVVAVPFIGYLLDNTRTVTVLSILVSIAATIGVLGLVPKVMWVAYAHILLFVVFRPFYYTAVSDVAAKVFGFATFGKVYGLIICMAGLGTFVQTLLDQLVWKEFRGNYRPVNIVLLILGATIGVILVSFVGWKGRTSKRELLEREAEAAQGTERERLMPENRGSR